MKRRTFMQTGAAAAALGAILSGGEVSAQTSGGFKTKLKKSLYYSMLPETLSVEERFALALRVGFEGVEVPSFEDQSELARVKAAVAKTGIKIHSIMNQRHWGYPLSSPEATVVKKSIEGLEIALRDAKELGAEVVLLVPAVVNAETSYRDAWTRSQKAIRSVLPLAKELNEIIAVENVWNKFLLSPLEFARYVDEFESPHLRAYFDVGNIIFYGIPQDWIHTLGKRIVRVHVKGFDEKKRDFVGLCDGTIDWPAVRKAFESIEYSGWINAELGGGDEAYLTGVSQCMDKIFRGE
ncbi:MAG: sugar phosphate isomerase/epimerase family protein [Candidatus Latescibacterota bacterium]